ncbi:MAG: ATP-binding cassette domain-containing protein [Thermoleophilia bacterium]|nr:ATP-binding cassette domain-containing protein [Thermoleophilia bacterium]
MSREFLRVLTGPAQGVEVPLGDDLVLGRAASGAGALGNDEELSRQHARISRRDGQLVVEDLRSTNGTYLNGWRIPAPQVLNGGDRIQVGRTVLEVHLPAGVSATSVRRRPALLSEAYRPDARPGPPPALRARGVRKAYGALQVLKGLDLELEAGEICGLLGPNGAGKTTFVSIVAGLRAADAGSVEVNGVDALAQPRQARRFIGIAPQDLGVYPTMTVRRNLELFGSIAGLRGRQLRARVEEVAEALSLTDKLGAKGSTLSGGMQRRLHTGMALLHKPPLLILDEPTVGADIRTRQEILDLVKQLADDGHAVCYSTHYLPEIEELGATVAILEGGQIIARGSIAELIARYARPAVELHFDGPAPELSLRGEVTREASLVRITADDPAAAAAHAVSQLGAHAIRLKQVEIIRPSLDSVYLALTRRRYTGVRPLPPEVVDAVAAPPPPPPSVQRPVVGA